MDDEPTKATNDEVSECKRCAVQLGYYPDKYIVHFVRQSTRKTPEINRGYFARVKGVESFIHQFLKKAGENAQIINLGCGFDTLYWRLKEAGIKLSNFVDLDFPSVTARKCYSIKRNKHLLELIHEQDDEVKLSSTDLHAGNYHLMGVDLRNISELEVKLRQAEIDMSKPTLYIAECVFAYVESDCVSRLLSWVTSKFSSVMVVSYDFVNMNDIFGTNLISNLRYRGCTLGDVAVCKSLETQKSRYLNNGWQGAKAWDMVQIYYAIPPQERQRIEKIEFLDEQELLIQLFQHYCIVVAWQGTDDFADIDITTS